VVPLFQVSNYHEHDSLLANREDEGLSEEERRNAWAEYEREKRNPVKWVNGPGGPVRAPQSGLLPSASGLPNPWASTGVNGGSMHDFGSVQDRAVKYFFQQRKCGRYPTGCTGTMAFWDEHFVCVRCVVIYKRSSVLIFICQTAKIQDHELEDELNI
jgi:hypothetical protein